MRERVRRTWWPLNRRGRVGSPEGEFRILDISFPVRKCLVDWQKPGTVKTSLWALGWFPCYSAIAESFRLANTDDFEQLKPLQGGTMVIKGCLLGKVHSLSLFPAPHFCIWETDVCRQTVLLSRRKICPGHQGNLFCFIFSLASTLFIYRMELELCLLFISQESVERKHVFWKVAGYRTL